MFTIVSKRAVARALLVLQIHRIPRWTAYVGPRWDTYDVVPWNLYNVQWRAWQWAERWADGG